jgi:hypothetical protein
VPWNAPVDRVMTLRPTESAFRRPLGTSRNPRTERIRQIRCDLPRYVFLRCAGDPKPVCVDLTSLASVDLMSRSVRRARRQAGDAAAVTVTEMLPAPDQLWLTDVDGCRYSAELRVVAVDRHLGGGLLEEVSAVNPELLARRELD